jgi:chemotaxis protein CheX
MELIDEQIRRLTPEIWDAVLHLPLQCQDAIPDSGRRTVSACVHIAGAWNGAVALSCDIEFASQAAAIMFDLVGSVPSTADMQDALGELTNMVGGNIKALLPETCHLSLPSAVEVADFSVRILHSRLVLRIPFRSGDHSMIVSLLEREDRAA